MGSACAAVRKTASGSVKAASGRLFGVTVETNGSANATITLYDNIAGSGTIVDRMVVAGADFHGEHMLLVPTPFATGLYVTVSGAGAGCIVYYA